MSSCVDSEKALAAFADTIVAELSWRSTNPKITSDELTKLSCCLLDGDDLLGKEFIRLRSPLVRRDQGATYTPAKIVNQMVAWASSFDKKPVRIVDAGAGSGRYAVAASIAFPQAQIVAVEKDPLAAKLLRANLALIGAIPRSQIVIGDYSTFKLEPVKGRTLFIGNPPYLRHHQIPAKNKRWYRALAAKRGFHLSNLAGLHIHFFLKTLELGNPGDIGCFITAAEWLDVNYGQTLRDALLDGLGGTAIHVLNPKFQPFDDAMSTAAITTFEIGRKPDAIRMRQVSRPQNLKSLNSGTPIPHETLAKAPRWSAFSRSGPVTDPGGIELGELFRVRRGQVTGLNEVWIAREHFPGLPECVLFPTVTKARDLFAAGTVLKSSDALRRVIDIPRDIACLTARERRAVEAFLDWAKKCGADQSYTAQHRSPWWAIGLHEPAPLLCTYMARRPPAFIVNECNARHINIAHGLYPREPMSKELLARVAAFLRGSVTLANGRTYSGGLTKFEPKEVERLRIPSLKELAA